MLTPGEYKMKATGVLNDQGGPSPATVATIFQDALVAAGYPAAQVVPIGE